MKVRFTPAGERQCLAVLAYLISDRPEAARRLHKRVAKALKRLERFPESGRRIPEFPDFPHREIVVRLYRFFYRVAKDAVWIVGVWHGAQLPIRPAEGEK